jgi:hypothetical protein
MLPEEQGRHCLACSKTVIDFSTWEQEDILNYLQSKSEERVCGRFNESQLQPAYQQEKVLPLILKSNVSILKKIAAIVLICFGVMAGTESYGQDKIMGKPAHPKPPKEERTLKGDVMIRQVDTVKSNNIKPAHSVDTTKFQPQIMGMVAPPKTIKIDTVKPSNIKKRK